MTRDLGIWTAPACALVLIDWLSMNAFEDQAFRQAVEATGRKRLIVGGLHRQGRRSPADRRDADPDTTPRPGDRVLARLPGLRGDRPARADHRAGRDTRHPRGPVRRGPAAAAPIGRRCTMARRSVSSGMRP